MSYTYEQRKRPFGASKTPPLAGRSTQGPDTAALMAGQARPTAAQKGRSFDLDAAMQARMANTFGDLSAVRNYTPPEKSQAPAPTGPYTGPVTHAISDASPSPSVAGPMQAKREDSGSKSAAPPKPKKKSAPKKKKVTPVMASYRDLEDVKDYDRETDRLSLYDGGGDALREDEDADWVSPEMMRSYQARNDQKVGELSRIAAGLLADEGMAGQARDKIKKEQYQKYYAEEQKKGNKFAHDDAIRKAKDYYNANKPKLKKTVSKEDDDWYWKTANHASRDLIQAVKQKRLQAARKLVAYRDNMQKMYGGDEEKKLDFESAYTQQAREFGIYDRLMNDMSMSPDFVEMMREDNRNPAPVNEEDIKVTGRAAKLTGSFRDTNPFVETEEGKTKLPVFQELQNQAYISMYNAGREKKKKKKKT